MQLHSNNSLRPFATVIMRRQWNVPDQPFNRQYQHLSNKTVSYDNLPEGHVDDFLLQDINEEKQEDYFKEIDSLFHKEVKEKEANGDYPYEVMLFKKYLEYGSTRKVQAATGIPYRSVARTIAKFRKRIIEQLGKAGKEI